jgi:hypothetical protein
VASSQANASVMNADRLDMIISLLLLYAQTGSNRDHRW